MLPWHYFTHPSQQINADIWPESWPAMFQIFTGHMVVDNTSSKAFMMTSSNRNFFRVTGPWWLVDSSHKGQWRRALKFSLICAWTNSWANNRDADDLRRRGAHCDVMSVAQLSVRISLQMNLWKMVYSLHSKVTLLTHWGRDKMPAVLQTPISNAFSWVKTYEFRLSCHRSLLTHICTTRPVWLNSSPLENMAALSQTVI